MPIVNVNLLYFGTYGELDTNETNFTNETNLPLVTVDNTTLQIVAAQANNANPTNSPIRMESDDAGLFPAENYTYDLGSGSTTSALDTVFENVVTLTLGDGSTLSLSATFIQLQNGDVFIVDTNGDLDGLNIQSVEITAIGSSNFYGAADFWSIDGSGIVCFTADTLVKTDCGNRRIAELKKGDRVKTLGTGHQPIRWIGKKQLSASDLHNIPKLRPVRIMAGALGLNLPERDLLISRQHRMVVSSQVAQRMFGGDVLIPAIKLTELPGIFVDEHVEGVEYIHILFDEHEVIYAEGAPSESLYTGPNALKAISPEEREELLALFPELGKPDTAPDPVLPIPNPKQQKRLVSRHAANKKPLLESYQA